MVKGTHIFWTAQYWHCSKKAHLNGLPESNNNKKHSHAERFKAAYLFFNVHSSQIRRQKSKIHAKLPTDEHLVNSSSQDLGHCHTFLHFIPI